MIFCFERTSGVSRLRAALVVGLIGCSGGSTDTTSSSDTRPHPVPEGSPAAELKAVRPGASPFIAFVDLNVPGVSNDASVQYIIEVKPGSVSRPVNVTYTLSYLQQRGYFDASTGALTVPIFGLYQNYQNRVAVQVSMPGKSVTPLQVAVNTPAYTDPNGVYDHMSVKKARASGSKLEFDYFFMKSGWGSPVVVDTDGEMRWIVPGTTNSFVSTFHDNAFITGEQTSLKYHRLELDGTSVDMMLNGGASDLSNFHHDFTQGKVGLIAELDAIDNGIWNYENKIAEFDPTTGAVFRQWDLGDIISRYMRSQGDDPTAFVRPGVDWFHMNSVIYDASDDSLIASSRENFVIKIDYSSGDIIWILGDPTKYWYTFPSLAAKSLTLNANGFYPIGQHALSIAHDGTLMLFNDGWPTTDQPAGQPAGQTRTFSVVSRYLIDAATRSAVEVSRFDYGQSLFSSYCSSAYQASSDASMLVDYAAIDNQTHARLVGLDQNQSVVFDFEYPTVGCQTSWNAQPIAFDGMTFK